MSGIDPVENVLPADKDTLLSISYCGTFIYQARGLTQSLSLIAAATDNKRTINGKLINLAPIQFRKFITRITCTDVRAPPLDGLWPGMEVEIECAAALSYASGAIGCPTREAVEHSSYETASGITVYRPKLVCLITNFSNDFAEWQSDYQWVIEAEEV